ncbi:thioredoxin [Oscillospiraceae bacterium]|nr:thioredoxin [Oscillospiraceae bacterium]BDF75609.1 thioredoxin [Oscillospiraceae bacterium]
MAVIHFNKDGFDKALASGQLMMVDFWASWCGPCKMAAPIIESVAGEYEGKALVGKVNTDDEQELAVRYEVMSIPTVIFFKNGKEVERKVGVMPGDSYKAVLDSYL